MKEDSEWMPISSAPMDGTAIQAIIPGHGGDNIIAFLRGYIDANEEETGAWTFVEDQESPDCWTEGACWEQNEDNVPSVQPTLWKPIK